MANPKFEIYKDKAGEFRYRLKASNGEIIASGEGYTTKQSVKNGIESIKNNAPEAQIVDKTVE
ncbi:MAG: YegP family protein [Treponema sp.]|nr:YegP family protein [Treponema sp.]